MPHLAILAHEDTTRRVGGRVTHMDADALEQGDVEQQRQPLAELGARGWLYDQLSYGQDSLDPGRAMWAPACRKSIRRLCSMPLWYSFSV